MKKPSSLKRILLCCFYFIVGLLLVKAQDVRSAGSTNSLFYETKIQMSDVVLLATDIYLPGGNKKYPVVLIRTPYNKDSEKWVKNTFSKNGIAVVVQDVRGKYNSGGNFYAFVNERKDGLETLKWIRSQPWANGYVAGWGGSYVGYTQWAIADSLDFLTPVLTGANLYDLIYPAGVFSLQTAFLWGFYAASPTLNNIDPEKIKASYEILPLSVADDSTIKDIDYINEWLLHENYDGYWEKMNFRGIVKSPVVSMAGWYDIFLYSQIEDFQAIASNNPDNRLIIGPWCHGTQGEINKYGGERKTGKSGLSAKFAKNYILGNGKKLPKPLLDKKYNLFIMERNEYVGSDVWPPRETTSIPFYIGPDRYLATEKFNENGNLQYDYLPSDPYPGKGGTALGTEVGPALQISNINREDQLVFQMKIAEKPLILLGPVSASLWVQSSASCTGFVVCLQDVFPDGKIVNIQEGAGNVFFESEQPQKTEIPVWATGYELKKDHVLRVVITSGWFPRYNRNLNNCEPIYSTKTSVRVTQKVYFGNETPSSINLPVYKVSK